MRARIWTIAGLAGLIAMGVLAPKPAEAYWYRGGYGYYGRPFGYPVFGYGGGYPFYRPYYRPYYVPPPVVYVPPPVVYAPPPIYVAPLVEAPRRVHHVHPVVHRAPVPCTCTPAVVPAAIQQVAPQPQPQLPPQPPALPAPPPLHHVYPPEIEPAPADPGN